VRWGLGEVYSSAGQLLATAGFDFLVVFIRTSLVNTATQVYFLLGKKSNGFGHVNFGGLSSPSQRPRIVYVWHISMIYQNSRALLRMSHTHTDTDTDTHTHTHTDTDTDTHTHTDTDTDTRTQTLSLGSQHTHALSRFSAQGQCVFIE
jgi:hypothetical protein